MGCEAGLGKVMFRKSPGSVANALRGVETSAAARASGRFKQQMATVFAITSPDCRKGNSRGRAGVCASLGGSSLSTS